MSCDDFNREKARNKIKNLSKSSITPKKDGYQGAKRLGNKEITYNQEESSKVEIEAEEQEDSGSESSSSGSEMEEKNQPQHRSQHRSKHKTESMSSSESEDEYSRGVDVERPTGQEVFHGPFNQDKKLGELLNDDVNNIYGDEKHVIIPFRHKCSVGDLDTFCNKPHKLLNTTNNNVKVFEGNKQIFTGAKLISLDNDFPEELSFKLTKSVLPKSTSVDLKGRPCDFLAFASAKNQVNSKHWDLFEGYEPNVHTLVYEHPQYNTENLQSSIQKVAKGYVVPVDHPLSTLYKVKTKKQPQFFPGSEDHYVFEKSVISKSMPNLTNIWKNAACQNDLNDMQIIFYRTEEGTKSVDVNTTVGREIVNKEKKSIEFRLKISYRPVIFKK